MGIRTNILVASRSQDDVTGLHEMLSKQPAYRVQRRVIVNGHADPLYGVETTPDLLIFAVGEGGDAELDALSERPVSERPPIIVIGPDGDSRLVRKAMRAGARDFFPRPVSRDELMESVRQVAAESGQAGRDEGHRSTAVINGKGGSGATLVATNIAHTLAAVHELEVALVDVDIQFGSLPLYLDIDQSSGGLLDALAHADGLDAMAIEGYMLKHASGVQVLSSPRGATDMADGIEPAAIQRLLDVLEARYAHVVFDVPRQLNAVSSAVLERAGRTLVVIEQSVAHVRDAKRLVEVLQWDLGVPPEQITLVVNRYDKRGSVSPDDISNSIGGLDVVRLANDFRTASESINLGVPLHDLARNGALTRGVARLGEICAGTPERRKRGILSGLFGGRATA